MEDPRSSEPETYNPWTVVNVVFSHLAEQGLHPVLGATGDPGPPARTLLKALGIEPAAEGNREVMREVRAHLEQLRLAAFEDLGPPGRSEPDPAGPGAVST